MCIRDRLDADLAPQDVLQFPGYPEKLEAQTGKTGLKEAVITATGRIEGTPVVAAVLDLSLIHIYRVQSPSGWVLSSDRIFHLSEITSHLLPFCTA